MRTLTLPERVVATPTSLEEGQLRRTKSQPLVATGTHVDSNISLYHLCYEGRPQASVFCYPSTVSLDSGKITGLDSKFTNPRLIISRKVDNTSPDDVYSGLLRAIPPLLSFMDHRYTFCGAQVHEHSFLSGWSDYIRDAITHLKT